MNKKVSLGAAIAFMLIVAAATFSLTWIYAQTSFNQKSANLERRNETYAKLYDIDSIVRSRYSGTINDTQLMDSISQGYIKGLGDKYATYLTAEEFRRLTKSKVGEDVGIGAVLSVSPEGYLSVTEVYPDSPAQVAGIAVGDLIVQVDDTNLTLENAEAYIASIQGEAGAKLSLVVRKGTEEILIPELTRRAVAVPSVYSKIIPETNVGYIIIKQFNDNTADQFSRELNRLTEANVDSLIFDIRDNKGASVSSTMRILDKLVPEGVLYSAMTGDGRIEAKETSDATEISLPMVVITNSNTSSFAELFAQDLKDYGKASIVGTTTMGRGAIQERLKLSDGSAIDLTTALMVSANGVNFDTVGIKPDYDVALDGDWTGLDETSDPQLKKAIEVVMAMRKAEVTAQSESGISESQAPPPQSEPSSSQPVSVEPEDEPEDEPSDASDESSSSDGEENSEDSGEETGSEGEGESGGGSLDSDESPDDSSSGDSTEDSSES